MQFQLFEKEIVEENIRARQIHHRHRVYCLRKYFCSVYRMSKINSQRDSGNDSRLRKLTHRKVVTKGF